MSGKHQTAPITESNWVDYTIKTIKHVSTKENIVFYSNKQLQILVQNENRFNKLILTGGFGVGKSFLLVEKAILLSKDPAYRGKIVYSCLFEHFERGSLFFHNTRRQLEAYGITCISASTNVILILNFFFKNS